MIVNLTKHTNAHDTRVISLFHEGSLIFRTLDDGFGMDRVRDWAKCNGATILDPKKN